MTANAPKVLSPEPSADDRRRAVLEAIDTFCRIFRGPDPSLCSDLLERGMAARIDQLTPLLISAGREAVREADGVLGRFEDAGELFDHLEAAYVSLFISNLKGRVVPLYHSCHEYEGAPMMGAPAARMDDLLAGAGLGLGSHVNEPPDHLSIELEYLYFLLSGGWGEGKGSTPEKAAAFASRTMLPWVSEFKKRLSGHRDSEFYLPAAGVLAAVLQLIGNSPKLMNHFAASSLQSPASI